MGGESPKTFYSLFEWQKKKICQTVVKLWKVWHKLEMENISSSVAQLLLLNVNIVGFQFVSIFMVEGQVFQNKKQALPSFWVIFSNV